MITGKRPIVVVGSINIDLVAIAERIPARGETVLGKSFRIHPGGKGANQAVAVARLGYPVRMIGRLGEDAFGVQLRKNLGTAGVDIAGVTTTESASGVAMIVVEQEGENSIVVTAGANALVTPQDLERNIGIIRSSGLVLTQLEIPVETVEYLARICSREDVPLILDPAPAQDLPETIFQHIAWFTPNETEAAFFLGRSDPSGRADPDRQTQMLLKKDVRGVVLKLGPRGAYIASADGVQEALPPFPVDAIDTTAAGDAFNGAFATALMLGMKPAKAARFAAAAAAISVTKAGAQSSMPNMEEVERLIRSTASYGEPQM